MNEKVIANAERIIAQKAGQGHCTLALINENGYPTASTVSIVKADGIKWMTFGVTLSENKSKRVAKCNRASVCVNSDEYNITLVGTAEIITDAAVKQEMWKPGFEHHWSGADDPEFAVLRFNTEQYSLFVGWEFTEGTL